MSRIEHIRSEEKKYHDLCYENYKLFEAGSWLNKPVQSVMKLIPLFSKNERIKVLDLGCGVGRNSIPIAKAIREQNGLVTCVDLLDSAINKLKQYSIKHGVREVIQPVKSDIESFKIQNQEYDFIVAVSSLEHVQSIEDFEIVVRRMAKGTKMNGINCIIVNTEVEEIDIEANEKLEALMEINLSTEEMLNRIKDIYLDWEVIETIIKPLEYNITRNAKSLLLKTNAVTFVVKKIET